MRNIARLTIILLVAASAAVFANQLESVKVKPGGKVPPTGPETVVISAAQAKQPPVTFSHEKHTKITKSCDTCHHTNKGMTAEKPGKVEKCSTCHLDPKDKAVPGMREMGKTNIFHDACITCHTTGKKGPTLCKDCHVKETKS